MLRTMRKCRGMGLAANQVGSEMRIAVVENRRLLKRPLIMINPKITEMSEKQSDAIEGCLSIPKEGFVVRRPTRIVVKYTNQRGESKSLKATNLLARIIMHEISHLDGVTIRDMAIEHDA